MPTIRSDASQRIDEYIAKAPPVARSICIRLRRIIHKADPSIVEDWKWGPNFNCHGMVCGFGAFKHHATLTFFQGALLSDPKKILEHGGANVRTRSIKFDDPSTISEPVLLAYIREAVRNNKKGLKASVQRASLPIPTELRKVFRKHPRAQVRFNDLPYTHRKEYVLWIESAKKEETKARRINETLRRLKAAAPQK